MKLRTHVLLVGLISVTGGGGTTLRTTYGESIDLRPRYAPGEDCVTLDQTTIQNIKGGQFGDMEVTVHEAWTVLRETTPADEARKAEPVEEMKAKEPSPAEVPEKDDRPKAD